MAGGRPGDWGLPYAVGGLPFVHTATTAGRTGLAARYAPRPDLSEAEPEVVYRVRVGGPGRLSAWVDGDTRAAGGAVDVDVHPLASLDLDARGTATGGLARGDRGAVVEVDGPGVYYVAVDTYGGPERALPAADRPPAARRLVRASARPGRDPGQRGPTPTCSGAASSGACSGSIRRSPGSR